jgi:hypothetical protein
MFNGGQHSFRRPAQNGQSNQAKRQRAQTQHVNPQHLSGHHNAMMQSFFGFPDMNQFGFGSPAAGFSSFSAFSSGNNGGRSGGGVVKSTSKSTKVVNGKKYITTK